MIMGVQEVFESEIEIETSEATLFNTKIDTKFGNKNYFTHKLDTQIPSA